MIGSRAHRQGQDRKMVVVGALVAALVACLVAAGPAAAAPGDVLAWGWNGEGQLGNGNIGGSNPSPGQVADVADARAISAGCKHNLALEEDGTVRAWGWNTAGQLGDGTFDTSDAPVQVTGLSDVKAVAAGCIHSLALKEDGTVWAWGGNYYGQLGDGTTDDSNVPVQVRTAAGKPLGGVKAIAAGESHTIALKENGSVWTWGGNDSGQLGDGTTDGSFAPVQVRTAGGAILRGVKAIEAGQSFSMVLKNDGSVRAWGENGEGELGIGVTSAYSAAPVRVHKLADVRAINVFSDGEHALALKKNGRVLAWGWNSYGQLGDGTDIGRYEPVRVKNLSGVKAITAGYEHGLALKKDGTVWAWGENDQGQLGDGTTDDSFTPVQVKTTGGSPLTGVKALSAGDYHSVALQL